MTTVIQLAGDPVSLDGSNYDQLKALATSSPLRRARICLHQSPGDPIHEMVICLCRNTYVRPHRHHGKSESMHILEGRLTLAIFDDAGHLVRSARLGPFGDPGRVHLHRMTSSLWHMVLPETETVLVHEVITGPFTPPGAEFAAWAPADDSPDAAPYAEDIRRQCAVRE